MPKIESIRPGGTLEGSFAEYPLAELLVGVLRANLTGRLELFFGQERPNEISFKDGVPVSVDLPDLGVTVARMLLDKGLIEKDVAFDILRQSEETGRSESALIVEERILSEGAMLDARRKRARAQVVRLFDAITAEFRFTEGAPIRDDAKLSILQPLPIVFEGLLKATDRTVVNRFLEELGGSEFKLGATYPRGVDPFEWGPRLEAVAASLDNQKSLAELEAQGLARDLAAVMMTTLHLAGMIEVVRAGASKEVPVLEYVHPPRGDGGSRRISPTRPDPAEGLIDEKDPSGLVIMRRSSGAMERPRSDPRQAPIDPAARNEPGGASQEGGSSPARMYGGAQDVRREPRDPSGGFRPMSRSEVETAQHEAQLEQIAGRLNQLKGKSYFKVLRVADNANQDQIERSFRYLVRQVDEQGDDAPARALRDAFREAYDVLLDPSEGRRYRELNERAKLSGSTAHERQAFEAARKVERAVAAMVDGRIAEAMHLLDWAQQLEPARKDVKAYKALVRYFRAPRSQRAAEAHALKSTIGNEAQRAPHDRTMLLCYALLMAEEKDYAGAEQLIARAERPDHPLVRRIREVLSAHS